MFLLYIISCCMYFMYYTQQYLTINWGLSPFKSANVSGEFFENTILFALAILFANCTLGPFKACISKIAKRKTILRFFFLSQHVCFLFLVYTLCLARTSTVSDNYQIMLSRSVLLFLTLGMFSLSAIDSVTDKKLAACLGTATYAIVSTYGQKAGGKALNALFQDLFKTRPWFVFYAMCIISIIVFSWQINSLSTFVPMKKEETKKRPVSSFGTTLKIFGNLICFPPFLMVFIEALVLDMIQSSIKVFMVHAKDDDNQYFMGSASATSLTTFELIAVLLAARTLWFTLKSMTDFKKSWLNWSMVHALFTAIRVILTFYMVYNVEITKESVLDDVEPYGYFYHRKGSSFIYRTDDLDDGMYYITIFLVMLNAISDTCSSAFLSKMLAERSEETGISLAAQESIVRIAQYLPMALAFLRHIGALSFYKGSPIDTFIVLGIFCIIYAVLFAWNRYQIGSTKSNKNKST